jgi:hypothetical protein
MKAIIALILILLATGCARKFQPHVIETRLDTSTGEKVVTETIDPLLKTANAGYEAQKACFEWFALSREDRNNEMSGMPESTRALLIDRQIREGKNPCDNDTNVFDYLATETVENNKTIRAVQDTAGKVLITGIWADLAKGIASIFGNSKGDVYKNSEVNTSSKNTASSIGGTDSGLTTGDISKVDNNRTLETTEIITPE